MLGVTYNLHRSLIFHILDPMAPPAPVIQASTSSVVVGENLRVSCTVVGEQDVAIEVTWEYPGQQVRMLNTVPFFFLLHHLTYRILPKGL